MREVFLSHAGKDHSHAKKLRDLLVIHGIPVWFSPHHVRGAEQWQDEVGLALNRCGWFLLLLTPNAVTSMWVKRELNFALIEKRYEGRIIPVLLKDCNYQKLSWTLPQYQIIDLRRDYKTGFEELVRIWRRPRR